MLTLSHSTAMQPPSRFSDSDTLAQCRKMLREACGPDIRFGFVLYRNKETRLWECHIFDRLPSWIQPHVGRTYSNASRRVVVADAVTYLEDMRAAYAPFADQIKTAMSIVRPLNLPDFSR